MDLQTMSDDWSRVPTSHEGCEVKDGPKTPLQLAWAIKFFKPRLLSDNRTLVQDKKEARQQSCQVLGDDSKDNDIVEVDDVDFLCEQDGDNPDRIDLCEQILKQYLHDMSKEEEAARDHAAENLLSVWFHDRILNYGDRRISHSKQHQNPMTANELLEVLRKPWFSISSQPYAARRIVYVTDLDPACVWALAVTAYSHQAWVLRDAIFKYLTAKTSIAVKVPGNKFPRFHLDLHLSFFLMKFSDPSETKQTNGRTPERQWIDLSFLDLEAPKGESEKFNRRWGIYEVQVSCVVTGWDEFKWTAYGFVDSEVDAYLKDYQEDDLVLDPLSATEDNIDFSDGRPLQYWIRIFEIRIIQSCKAWEDLLHKVETGINRRKKDRLSILSEKQKSKKKHSMELESASIWNFEMLDLLALLDSKLADTIEAWRLFEVGYFDESEVHEVKDSFRQLHGFHRRITQFQAWIKSYHEQILQSQESCKRHLKLRLLEEQGKAATQSLQLLKESRAAADQHIRLLEESKAATDHNRRITDFSVSILYPFALTAAIFSMQSEVIPFDLSPRSFIIALVVLTLVMYVFRYAMAMMWSLSMRKPGEDRTVVLPRLFNFTSYVLWGRRESVEDLELGFPSLRH